MTNIETRSIVLKLPDGSEMGAFVARPPGDGRMPGLLVLQEAYGVNRHIRDVAKRFAAEGYLVIAPELFHRSAPRGWEGDYDDFNAIMPHYQAMTAAGLDADLRASCDWLAADSRCEPSRIGSIGYCLGGRATFVANATLPLKAAVSYYGGHIAPELLPLAGQQHAPILLVWGGLDRHIGPEQSRAVNDALRKAGKAFIDIEFGDADHGFFCDERTAYNAVAARQAWALTKSFLEANLKG